MINPEYAFQAGDRSNIPNTGVGYVGASAIGRNTFRRVLLLSSGASISLLAVGSRGAHADCVETPAGFGTFECSGAINSGFTSTGQSVIVNADSTATFNADVSITGPGTSVINNNGT